MNELDAATPERLYRAARRELGDTSDAVWCGNDDDRVADSRLLARYYLQHSKPFPNELLFQAREEYLATCYGFCHHAAFLAWNAAIACYESLLHREHDQNGSP